MTKVWTVAEDTCLDMHSTLMEASDDDPARTCGGFYSSCVSMQIVVAMDVILKWEVSSSSLGHRERTGVSAPLLTPCTEAFDTPARIRTVGPLLTASHPQQISSRTPRPDSIQRRSCCCGYSASNPQEMDLGAIHLKFVSSLYILRFICCTIARRTIVVPEIKTT